VAFDNDRAWWGQSLATAYWQNGDLARARAYGDSSLLLSKSQAEGAPNDSQLRVLYGLMLAYSGKASEARAAAELALKLNDEWRQRQRGYVLLNAARIELALGNKSRALDHLEASRALGGHLTPQWLMLDPTFASLKGEPRFEKLVKGT
jgi:tetratricopeptide (TPR) repeat protein